MAAAAHLGEGGEVRGCGPHAVHSHEQPVKVARGHAQGGASARGRRRGGRGSTCFDGGGQKRVHEEHRWHAARARGSIAPRTAHIVPSPCVERGRDHREVLICRGDLDAHFEWTTEPLAVHIGQPARNGESVGGSRFRRSADLQFASADAGVQVGQLGPAGDLRHARVQYKHVLVRVVTRTGRDTADEQGDRESE